jgi:site-specific DNA recombinase
MEQVVQKTGIIYSRVSSSEQVAGTSLAMQERSCREYAEREGIKILECYVEEGESAKTANRTEFQKALVYCSSKKQKVDFFIVHKLDRFARSQEDHAVTQAFLRKNGTKLRSVSEPISEDPVGKAMEGMLSVFAEFDNNVRSARSKSGMVERVKQGIWCWTAPIGYKRLTRGGNLVIDEEKAHYVRLAFEEWSKGTYSLKSLADFLAARGFRTQSGKKPFPQLIHLMIHNPLYCGIIRVFDMEVKGAFAPIVDEDLFLRCQPRTRRKFGSANHVTDNPNFPLRRFALCTACNSNLTASFSTGRKGVRYPYYHHHKQNCVLAKNLSKESIEQNFVEYLGEVSPRHKKYEKVFKAVVIDVWRSNYKRLDADNARARKEIEVLESERQRVFDLHIAGTYSDAEFKEQKAYINQRIEEKKTYLDEKRIEEFSMESALDFCFELVRDSGKTWTELLNQPEYRLRFQKMIFPRKVTYDGKKFDTTKTSLVFEINQTSGADSSKVVRLPGFEPGTISLRGSCSTN